MKRMAIAAVAGAVHLFVTVASYIVAFALGSGATASMYRVLQVLTFPTVWLAERFRAPPLGPVYFLANSAVWAGAVYLVLVAVRLPRERAIAGDTARSSGNRG